MVRRTFTKFFICLMLFIFLASGYLVLYRQMEYKEAETAYDELQDDQKNVFTVDWEKLEGTDTVAWIRFPGMTKLSYPVMQCKNNSFYLNHLYNKEYNPCGAIFMNSGNSADLTDQNTIIYGHRMQNKSMFGLLHKYREESFFKKKGKKIFYIYLPDGTRHTYRISSVAIVRDGTSVYTYKFSDVIAFREYLGDMAGRSLYNTGQTVTVSDNVVTLSTCATSHSMQRLVVQGVEIGSCNIQEAASWYKK